MLDEIVDRVSRELAQLFRSRFFFSTDFDIEVEKDLWTSKIVDVYGYGWVIHLMKNDYTEGLKLLIF